MDNRDDIEKIDEQINMLKNKKNVVEENNNDQNHEVFIDRKYSLGDKVPDQVIEEEMEKTKVIEDINQIELNETNVSNEEVKEETKEEEKVEEDTDKNNENNDSDIENKNKKKIILLVILFAILVIFICVLFIMTKKDKSGEIYLEDEYSEKIDDEKEIINEYGKKLEEAIRSYYYENGSSRKVTYELISSQIDYRYYIYCFEHEIYDDGRVYLNDCSINGKETKYGYGEKIVKPKADEDGDFHVYFNNETFEAQFENPHNTRDYIDFTVKIDDVYGNVGLLNSKKSPYIFYLDSEKNGHIVNFKTGRKALATLNYKSIIPIKNGDTFDYDYAAVFINPFWGIYKLSNNERIVPHNYDNMVVKNVGTNTNDNYIDSFGNGEIAVIYNGSIGVLSYYTGQIVIQPIYKSLIKTGNYYIVVDSSDNKSILDFSGEEILEDEYEEIYGMISDKYILAKKNDSVLLIGLDGELYYDYLTINADTYKYGTEEDGKIIFQFMKEDKLCVNLYYDTIDKTGEMKNSECN